MLKPNNQEKPKVVNINANRPISMATTMMYVFS